MISVKHLMKTYGDVKVLTDVNAVIEKGEAKIAVTCRGEGDAYDAAAGRQECGR